MWTNYRTFNFIICFLSFAYWFVCLFRGWEQAQQRKEESTFCNLEKHRKDFIWEDEHDGEAIELALSKKKIEERMSWLRQFEVRVLPCFLLVFLDKVNEYISTITSSECAGWYSPWSDGQAHKIQWLCQQGAYIVFNGRSSEVCSPHGWWPEAWPKENYFLLFQEVCCVVFWLCLSIHLIITVSRFLRVPSSEWHKTMWPPTTLTCFNEMANLALERLWDEHASCHSLHIASSSVCVFSSNLWIHNWFVWFQGGKEHAIARYVHTRLSPITRFLFHKDDDDLLDYLNEDGQSNWTNLVSFSLFFYLFCRKNSYI